jgi:hypothetical protein
MSDLEKKKKSFFRIAAIVLLVTLTTLGGTPTQAKASTLSFITDPLKQVGTMYVGLGKQTLDTYTQGTASVLTSIDSFFSSLFGHTPEEATTVASSSPVSDSYTPPTKQTYSTYTPPPTSTEPNKNTSSTYVQQTEVSTPVTKTVTNTVYLPSEPAQINNGVTEAELEQRLATFAASLPQPINTTCYISQAGAAPSFYGGVGQSDVTNLQNSITNLQTQVTNVSNATSTGGSVSTSTIRSLFSATSPLAYNSTTGVFSTASGYSIPLTASSTQWSTFYNTPSTRITAGTNLCWSGNTLNVCGVSGGGLTNNGTGSSSIALGTLSTATGCKADAFGYGDIASGIYSSSFGYTNTACDYSSASGYRNTASCTSSSAFGSINTACGCRSSAFGFNNTASNYRSSAFGYNNTASNYRSSAFGYNNTACGCLSSALGYQNTASGNYSSAFGFYNSASGYYSSAYGFDNTASGYRSSASGYRSSASGNYSSASGYYNTASGTNSSAFGTCLNNSTACSTMLGINNNYLQVNNDGTVCFSSGAYVDSSGNFQSVSDRDKKENFTTLDPQTVLNEINSLPVTEWNYKNDDPSIKHVGPVAQDFYSTFNIGDSSTTISTIDTGGIALLGIQALSDRLDELEGSSTFASMTIPVESLTSTSSDSVWSTLQSFGAEVVDGVAYLKNVWVEKLGVNDIKVENGITLKDKVTGQYYCITMQNGTMTNEPGECDDSDTQPSQNSNQGQDDQDNQDNNASSTATSTATSTDSSATSTEAASSSDQTNINITTATTTSSTSTSSNTTSSTSTATSTGQ